VRYLREHGPSLLRDIVAHADVCSAGTARNATYALAQKRAVRRCDEGGSGTKATYELVSLQQHGPR
jgi:hypothetical protein